MERSVRRSLPKHQSSAAKVVSPILLNQRIVERESKLLVAKDPKTSVEWMSVNASNDKQYQGRNIPDNTSDSKVIVSEPHQPSLRGEISKVGLGHEVIVIFSLLEVEAVKLRHTLASSKEAVAEFGALKKGVSGGFCDDGCLRVEWRTFRELESHVLECRCDHT